MPSTDYRITPAVGSVVLALGMLTFCASADAKSYTLRHPGREHCRAHYARHVRIVREGSTHKSVRLRRVLCVYVTPKSAVQAPAAPAVTREVKLHAHLDPSFTRDPTNPFQVTYAYSASATTETINLGADHTQGAPEATPLPEGVLNFYSNGVLACSINVGGAAAGGECPVIYAGLGRQTVTTVYLSGELSATETAIEEVSPFTGSIDLTVAYTPDPEPEPSPAGEECEYVHGFGKQCRAPYRKWLAGHVRVAAIATTQYGIAPGDVFISAPGGLQADGSLEAPVCVLTPEATTEIRQVLLSGCPEGEGTSGLNGADSAWGHALSGELVEQGMLFVSAMSQAGAGYAIPDTERPFQFVPEV